MKTTRDLSASGGTLRFSGLNESQFNKLAGSDYTVPRFLVVVLVPPLVDSWVTMSSDGMNVRNLAYYHSLADQRRVKSPTTTRRRQVHVPIGNVLTAESLERLVRTAGQVPAIP